MDGFRDVDFAREVCRLCADGRAFRRSPAFSVPEAAQRWAMQMRQEGEMKPERLQK
jgi:cell division activator